MPKRLTKAKEENSAKTLIKTTLCWRWSNFRTINITA
jgi:hypothetical protein